MMITGKEYLSVTDKVDGEDGKRMKCELTRNSLAHFKILAFICCIIFWVYIKDYKQSIKNTL